MEAEGLQGVLVDAGVLFREDRNGAVEFKPDVPHFLCRLRYSNLCIGILLQSTSQESYMKKEFLLREIGVAEGLHIITLERGASATGSVSTSGWGVPFTTSVYITAQQNEAIQGDLIGQGWTIIGVVSVVTERGSCFGSAGSTVDQLYEIPASLAMLNKRALRDMVVVVGYTMKWSRELEFLKRGALPILQNNYGLSFLPIQLDRPLEQQLMAVDVVLHKATDEIMPVHSGHFNSPASIQFSDGIYELQRYLQEHTHICVVDPIDRVLPLLDRVATQAILQDLTIRSQQIIRSPRSVEVTTFEEPWLSEAIEKEKIVLPTIVKPRIACGTSEAHSMAIVFNKDGFKGLPVPVPATIQEYVDHGSSQYKIYVVGSKILYSCRQSTPNASILAATNNNAPAIHFDSLKSLPVDKGAEAQGRMSGFGGGKPDELDLDAVQKAANWLRSKLGLTIIGFDIVVQMETNDYVIVDVNYFPSFKDVPDAEAIPAFWEALLTAYRQWTSQRQF